MDQEIKLREQPTKVVRRFIANHKNPVIILLLSALVGTGAGLLSTLFDICIDWIDETRHHFLSQQTGLWSDLSIGLLVCISSALLTMMGFWLVYRFAPEASGSGIPEIEGALDNVRPVRWWRVIPVKFFGGIGTIGAGLVLGREGPSVQMGGAVGRMLYDIFRLKDDEGRHTLVASGAAGGLAAAFNAPLAGIMFVIEEMRPQFRYNLVSVKAVMISAVMATIVYRSLQGQEAMITLPTYDAPPLLSLALFLLLGLIFGAFGVLFNRLVVGMMDGFERWHRHQQHRFLLLGAGLGGFFGLMLLWLPDITGEGVELIPAAAHGNYALGALAGLFAIRLITTLACFSSGAPGGVFAPMLALGTLFGTLFGLVCQQLFPSLALDAGMFAIAGMGALFAATVRAPITGILLVIELTENYDLILPLIITCLGATMMAQFLGGQPIYSQLLKRTLAKQAAEPATASPANSSTTSAN
ncbi:H(+)/Cl(-) exchange transporter ClcA [Shewanella sp. NIFS-20-20]|uniref:H(+)/Cl(-) exchange transporter ClcA n=1 Tax=Shewanella sp. NIFS-20-20 TaxID=2853806 RepID=UPI001C46E7C2|nr:H(+)/Cl(-) exchange transporter ClcA [Shewanella sp. NIFS-20-20]MBV7316359.1 H(+)/Cl(-) exchange transporter ClcA [Shewanella sp. NIFS-20-20]